jgi:glycosyltransferase involved in cell wall biosynthesis
MIIANLSNLCWAQGQRRRNQSIFSHLLLNTDGFEEGFFIQPPMVKTARTFQFSRPVELEVVLKSKELGRPVTVLQPVLTLPAGYPQAASRRAASDLSQKLLKEVFQNRHYFLWINSITHFQAQIAEQLSPGAAFRVFDSGESLMMYERNGDSEQLKQRTALLKSSDAAVFANEQVQSHLDHPAKFQISNCTDYSVFQKFDKDLRIDPLFPKAPGAIYIGFTGMITAERLDFDLMHAILTRFSAFQFIFVGSTNRPSLLARLKTYRNFHHIAEVRDEVLSSILNQLDVAIVPELDNEYTRGADSTKVMDYLACGLPVLSMVSPGAETYRDSIYTAGSVWEFSNSLERLTSKMRPHEPRFGRAVAQKHSWCNQVPQMVDWLFERERERARSAQPLAGKLGAIVKAYL